MLDNKLLLHSNYIVFFSFVFPNHRKILLSFFSRVPTVNYFSHADRAQIKRFYVMHSISLGVWVYDESLK